MIPGGVGPTATAARLGPRRAANRRYCEPRYVPSLRPAACAACTSATRSHRLPLVALPLRRLPALSLLPGPIPARLARCRAVGD